MIFSLSPLGSESRFVGWRFAALIGGIVGAIALAMYPIAVDPYFNPDKYKDIQREAGLDKLSRKKLKQAAYADCGDKSRWKDPKYRYILKENEDIK